MVPMQAPPNGVEGFSKRGPGDFRNGKWYVYASS